MKKVWLVRVPNRFVLEPRETKAAWHFVVKFYDRDDAVRFVHETYGGDEEGRVQLIIEDEE